MNLDRSRSEQVRIARPLLLEVDEAFEILREQRLQFAEVWRRAHETRVASEQRAGRVPPPGPGVEDDAAGGEPPGVAGALRRPVAPEVAVQREAAAGE